MQTGCNSNHSPVGRGVIWRAVGLWNNCLTNDATAESGTGCLRGASTLCGLRLRGGRGSLDVGWSRLEGDPPVHWHCDQKERALLLSRASSGEHRRAGGRIILGDRICRSTVLFVCGLMLQMVGADAAGPFRIVDADRICCWLHTHSQTMWQARRLLQWRKSMGSRASGAPGCSLEQMVAVTRSHPCIHLFRRSATGPRHRWQHLLLPWLPPSSPKPPKHEALVTRRQQQPHRGESA